MIELGCVIDPCRIDGGARLSAWTDAGEVCPDLAAEYAVGVPRAERLSWARREYRDEAASSLAHDPDLQEYVRHTGYREGASCG